MKIRRITLAVLVLLTLLMVLDARYFPTSSGFARQPSLRLEVGRRRTFPHGHVEKTFEFDRPQGELTSLVIYGEYGTVKLKSTDSDELKVRASIIAEKEEDLLGWEVVEKISEREVSYRLGGKTAKNKRNVGINFEVEVPAGMEVVAFQNFGKVDVEDFVGYLQLETRFSAVNVNGLEGSLSIDNQFGGINLKEIAGPLTVDDSFGTSQIGLVSIDGGYDFQVEVSNGSLKGSAPLQTEHRANIVTARGKSGEGLHPVVIKSGFGIVQVDLD